jgi:hypothetical protein
MTMGRAPLAALLGLMSAGCVASQDPSLLTGGPARYGRGSDGPLDSGGNRNTNVNTVVTVASGRAGSRQLTVAKTDELIAGTLVLVHDSQGAGAGTWELALIERVSAGMLTLTKPLQHSYPPEDHAQAVRVLQHDVIELRSGDGMTAPNWDGTSGGILALMASTRITIDGDLHQNGAGFRGERRDDSCPMTFQCLAGVSGESALGAGSAGGGVNGAGGGGGGIGECNQGGGGAYGGVGGGASASMLGDGIDSCDGSGSAPGGGGAVAGSDALGEVILFGGAGGEGGGDDDSVAPGGGGDGGGIIMLWAPEITINGHIGVDGANGGPGTAGSARRTCATGCGAGGGGGGAGGAVYLVGDKVAISGTVTARGGSGGACSCTDGGDGGAGGAGRIGVHAADVSGVTDPPFSAR